MIPTGGAKHVRDFGISMSSETRKSIARGSVSIPSGEWAYSARAAYQAVEILTRSVSEAENALFSSRISALANASGYDYLFFNGLVAAR